MDEKDSEIILEKKGKGDILAEGGPSQANLHGNFYILHPEARAPEPLLLPSSNQRSHPQDVKHHSSPHPLSGTEKPERAEKSYFQRLDTLRH